MKRILIALTLLSTLSCYYGDPGATSSPSTPSDWSLIGLTPSGADTLNIAGDMAHTDVTAPSTNAGANTRIGWVVDAGNFEVNEVCATWTSHTGAIDQPGLLVHFDGTHGITMTQNIWGFDRSVFNFHAWDLSQAVDSGRRFTAIGSFKPSGVGDGQAWPLRACLRAVGPFLDAKVWSVGQAEPAYGDPAHAGGSLIIDQPGRAGWYAGHVGAGGRLTYDQLTEFHGN